MINLIKRCVILFLASGSLLLYFLYGDFVFFEFAILPQEVSERSNEIIALILLCISLVAILIIALWIDIALREKCANLLERFLDKVMKCRPDE